MKFSYSLLKEFAPQLPPKKRLVEELNLKAFEAEVLEGDALDISLPANRYADAASHWGIAKEASAIFDTKISLPAGFGRAVNMPSGNNLLLIKVEDPGLCSRYDAVLLSLEKKSASPAWLKKRLETCGLRPISLIVDIMNYAMLETGQPLHAFDYDKIAGEGKSKKIIVRRAKAGERMEALDGKTYQLSAGDLVIADKDGILAIAGIKGGRKAEIDSSTRKIVIESANFLAPSVYSTSRRLNLVTDASARFSRDLSPELAEYGANRAAYLVKELAGGKVIDSLDYYPRAAKSEIIGFSAEKAASVLGVSIRKNEAAAILKKLGMAILTSKNKRFDFLVQTPVLRRDLQTMEDLIEEVGRIYGYDNIPSRPPHVSLKPAETDDILVAKRRTRDFLRNLGFSEIYSYSFFGRSSSDWIWSSSPKEKTLLEIQNPIASDKKYLRGELTSYMLAALQDNSRHFDELRIFEVGKVFSAAGERFHLTISFGSKDKAASPALKGVVNQLLLSFGITEIFFRPSGSESTLIEIDHNVVGRIGVVDGRDRRAVAELDLEEIKNASSEEFEYRALPKYPSISRDLSLEFDSAVPVGDVLEEINRAKAEHLWDVDVTDYYDQRRFTLRLVFQAWDKTLRDEEAEREAASIINQLKRKFSFAIR